MEFNMKLQKNINYHLASMIAKLSGKRVAEVDHTAIAATIETSFQNDSALALDEWANKLPSLDHPDARVVLFETGCLDQGTHNPLLVPFTVNRDESLECANFVGTYDQIVDRLYMFDLDPDWAYKYYAIYLADGPPLDREVFDLVYRKGILQIDPLQAIEAYGVKFSPALMPAEQLVPISLRLRTRCPLPPAWTICFTQILCGLEKPTRGA